MSDTVDGITPNAPIVVRGTEVLLPIIAALGGACLRVTLPLHHVTEGEVAPPAPDSSLDRAVLDGLIEELHPAVVESFSIYAVEKRSGLRRPRVLVVEDNADMNRFITQSLIREYEVISAFDGRDGLEKALRFQPVVVVCDIMMPNVSGVEMIAEMRKQPGVEHVASSAALRESR